MNGWMDGSCLSLPRMQWLLLSLLVQKLSSNSGISIFRQRLLLLLLLLLLRVKSVSPPDIGDMSQTLQRSIFNKRNKKKKKKTWTNGHNKCVPGSFHTGVAMQHICTCTHGTTFFLLLPPPVIIKEWLLHLMRVVIHYLIIKFLPVGLATLQRPNY